MRSFVAAMAVTVLCAMPVRAEDAAKQTELAQPYQPGLGEIMSLQQMRHSKLWFAGSAGNWPLANYELDELKEGFDDVRKLFPTHDGVRLTPLLDVVEKAAMPDLAKAIAAHDAAKFVD